MFVYETDQKSVTRGILFKGTIQPCLIVDVLYDRVGLKQLHLMMVSPAKGGADFNPVRGCILFFNKVS